MPSCIPWGGMRNLMAMGTPEGAQDQRNQRWHQREEPEGDEQLRARLSSLLRTLPPVDYAFAYGSGVFSQSPQTSGFRQQQLDLGVVSSSPRGQEVEGARETRGGGGTRSGDAVAERRRSEDKPMVDFILGVTSPSDWHDQNMELNKHHYTSMLVLGKGPLIAWAADNVGVGIHFNTHVLTLQPHEDVHSHQQRNVRAALAAALLTLPQRATEEELFGRICGLSYSGDVRMMFAEDINKVQRIVRGNVSGFRSLYATPLHELESKGVIGTSAATAAATAASAAASAAATATSNVAKATLLPARSGYSAHGSLVCVEQDVSSNCRKLLLQQLPQSVLHRVARMLQCHLPPPISCSQQASEAIAHEIWQQTDAKAVSNALAQTLRSTVRRSSARQAVSGFLAAGLMSSGVYVRRKMGKALTSRWKFS